MTREDAARWAQRLEEVMDRIGVRFGRVEPPARAGVFARAAVAGGAQERLAVGRDCRRPYARWGAGLSCPGALGCRFGAR